jgi:O-antigen/teichoic acid export membrane protein
LAHNTAANYTGSFIVLGIGFLLTPLLVRSLGATQYGIWVLVGSLTAYFQLLDVGLSASLVRYVAYSIAQNRESELSDLASTVFALYLGLAAIAGLLMLALASSAPALFNLPPQDTSLATQTFILISINFMIALPTSLYHAILVGYQRIDLNNIANVVAQTVEAVLIVILLGRGYGLLAVAAISIFSTLVLAGGRLYFVRRMAPTLRFSLRRFQPALARQIFGYSAAVFVSQVAGLVLLRTDVIILGFFYPVETITAYALPYKLANTLGVLAAPLAAVFFPAYAEMQGRLDRERLRQLYVEGGKVNALLCTLMLVFLLAVGVDILALWIGPEYQGAGPILYPLAVFFAILAVTRSGGNLLVATGKAKLRMFVALLQIILNLGLCITFAARWAGPGLAAANAISMLVVHGLIMLPLVHRELGLSHRLVLRRMFLPLLWPAATTSLFFFLARRWLPITNWAIVAFYIAASSLVFGLTYYLLGANAQERADYLIRARRIFAHVQADS